MRHQTEVCPVSRRMMLLSLNPYPRHYSPAFAFSVFLYLLLYRLPSRFGFPPTTSMGEQQAYHVSCRYHKCNLGSGFTPRVQHLRRVSWRHPSLTLYHFGPGVRSLNLQHLSPVRGNDASTTIQLSEPYCTHPSAQVQDARTRHFCSRFDDCLFQPDKTSLSLAFRTPPLPATHGQVGYRWQNIGSHLSIIQLSIIQCDSYLHDFVSHDNVHVTRQGAHPTTNERGINITHKTIEIGADHPLVKLT